MLNVTIGGTEYNPAHFSIIAEPHNARGGQGKRRLDESDGGVGRDGELVNF